jgi:hypothetical protein
LDAATAGSDEEALIVAVAGREKDGGVGSGGTVDGRTGRDGMTGTDTDMSLWGTDVLDTMAGADADADADADAATGAGVIEFCNGVGLGADVDSGTGTGTGTGMGGGGGKSASGGGGGRGKARRSGLGRGRAGFESTGASGFEGTGSTFLPIGRDISMSMSLPPKSLSSVKARSIFLRVDAMVAGQMWARQTDRKDRS